MAMTARRRRHGLCSPIVPVTTLALVSSLECIRVLDLLGFCLAERRPCGVTVHRRDRPYELVFIPDEPVLSHEMLSAVLSAAGVPMRQFVELFDRLQVVLEELDLAS
jgi:hypothetical protein